MADPGHVFDPLPGTGMPGDVAAALRHGLAEIQALDTDGLRSRYRVLTRRRAPPHLPRWLLLRIVAWRLQAKTLGGLDAETGRMLDSLGRAKADLRSGRKDHAGKDGARRASAIPDVPPVPAGGRLRPGTLLVREHGDELHRVMVLEQGFEWQGRTFRSLSEVACAITGTVWSGPAFFGLNARRKRPPLPQGAEQ